MPGLALSLHDCNGLGSLAESHLEEKEMKQSDNLVGARGYGNGHIRTKSHGTGVSHLIPKYAISPPDPIADVPPEALLLVIPQLTAVQERRHSTLDALLAANRRDSPRARVVL